MEELASTKEILGDHLHQKIKEVCKSLHVYNDGGLDNKITGILLERSVEHIYQMLADGDVLKRNIQLALNSVSRGSTYGSSQVSELHALKSGVEKVDEKTDGEIADQLFDKVYRLYPGMAPQITGMLMELESEVLVQLLQDWSKFLSFVERSKTCLEQTNIKSHQGDDGSLHLESKEDFSNAIYYRAHCLCKEHAPKITGMILEMDDVLLQQIMKDSNSLDEAIVKANQVLQEALLP